MNKIIIAVDGFSSCGKSTLAKALAKELSYVYIDTGAMYRAVTLYFIRQDIDLNNDEAIKKALENITINFQNIEGQNHTFLNQEDIEEEIRKMYISNVVSDVASISAVRTFLVKQQKEMGIEKGIVMDGRDIGTVVFPEAEVKFFMTAEPRIRAQRRYDEILKKGQKVDFDAVMENLSERDRIDSTRSDSPLRRADDSIVVDNSYLTPDHQLKIVLGKVQEKLSNTPIPNT